MLAFFRRPRTQRLREYERQLAVQVPVLAIATISEMDRRRARRLNPAGSSSSDSEPLSESLSEPGSQ